MNQVRLVAFACALVTPFTGLAGQAGPPQSASYLFVASVDDARAVWVNPAGLAAVAEYSVTAGFSLENATTGKLRLGQWSAAFNSRGFAFGYQRDRLPDDPGTATADPRSTGAFRLATAVPFGSGALGASFSIYRGNSAGSELGGDLGLRFPFGSSLSVAAVLENIGRPVLGTVKAPLTGTVGFAWYPVPQVLEFAGEARAIEGLGAASTALLYRSGLHFSPDAGFPLSVFASVDLGASPTLRSFTIGASVGGADRVGALATGTRQAGGVELSQFGAFGVATRGPGGRPRP